MSNSNLIQPNPLNNAERMREINIPAYKQQTQFNMLKVLDTYKRSCDYYNSYGLNSARNSTRASRLPTDRPNSASTTFWDEALRF